MSNQIAPSPAVSTTEKSGPISVAIIEDHREFRDYLAALISGSEGFECTGSFRSVEESLPKINARVPHVILLDIGLPGMSGYEVAHRLRQQPKLKGIKLVAVTGYGQEDDRRRSSQAGFDEHLTKPVEPQTLQRLVVTNG